MQCLTKIYDPWREKNNFEKGCAEELYIKLLDDPEKYKGQLIWLKKIRIWEIRTWKVCVLKMKLTNEQIEKQKEINRIIRRVKKDMLK
jgi:hypothetical protein